MKIFFSYGHDRNAPLVERIAADLGAAGHSVWIDTARIKAGDDWRRSILDGLADTDWTLSFLSRHAVRDPGVCLDELAIALHVKGGTIATVLVEAEADVDPPVSVSHIQWLNMHDWRERRSAGEAAWQHWYGGKLDEIVAMLANPAVRRFAGEIEELDRRLRPIAQQADMGLLVDGFVGRGWLLEEVDRWRRQAVESRLFWLSGAPGAGKSAFAAWLAHRGRVDVVAFSLCRYNIEDRRDAARIIRTLAFEIATRLPDYRRLLLDRLRRHDPDGTELARQGAPALFSSLLAEPLRFGIDGGRSRHRHLVVIDALDETIRDGRSELAEILAESAAKLPPWIAFVVTSRPELPILRQFAGLQPHRIEADSDDNRADLRSYAKAWLAALQPPPAGAEMLVERLVAASGGNFLYVRTLRDAVNNGLMRLAAPEGLPQGLIGLYERWFRRQFPDPAGYEDLVPAIEILVAAEHRVPEEWLARLVGWSKRQLARTLEGLGSLFERRAEGVAPFHRSLRDWLVDDRAAGADFVVDPAAGRRRLVEGLWACFVEWAGARRDARLDPFCVAELPLQMGHAPPAQVRQALLPLPWPELWAGLAAQAGALADAFAWPAALAWWRMAASLAEAAGDAGRSHQGFALRAGGDIHRTLGRGAQARHAYETALALSRTHATAEPDDLDRRRAVYVSDIKVGGIRTTEGDLTGALAAFREGLDIMRGLSAADPGNRAWRRDLFVGLERIADTLLAQGHLGEALEAYRQSLDIVRALLAEEPDNPGWQRDFSIVLLKSGDVRSELGDTAAAQAAGREGLQILRRLSAAAPDDAGRLRDLCAGLSWTGDLSAARLDPSGSLVAYREALGVVRTACARDPANAGWRLDLHKALLKTADVLRRQGDLDEALAACRESLDIARGLAQGDPADAGLRREVSASLLGLGDVLSGRDDRAGAALAFRESADTLRDLAGRDPENSQWKADLVLSLWRLALAGDDPRGRLGEAAAVLARLAKEGRLTPDQQTWRADIEQAIGRLEGPAPATLPPELS